MRRFIGKVFYIPAGLGLTFFLLWVHLVKGRQFTLTVLDVLEAAFKEAGLKNG